MQFVNPIFDQSRFTVYTSRWNDMHTTTAQLLEDAGCMIRAYTWLTEDKTGPHPELEIGLKDIPFIGGLLDNIADSVGLPDSLDDLVRPLRNCVVMAVEDKSGTTGPTGTLIDGSIKLAAATADDLITETIYPVDKDMEGHTDPFFRKLALTAPAPPWVVFRDGEYSGIVESQRSLHACDGENDHGGLKIAGWVNQLQTFGIKYGLAQAVGGDRDWGLREKRCRRAPRASRRCTRGSSTTHCSRGSGSPTRAAPYVWATSASSNTSNKAAAPPTPSPPSSTYAPGTGKPAPTSASKPPSATAPPTSPATTSNSVTGSASRWATSSTSTNAPPSATRGTTRKPITVELSIGRDTAEEDPVGVATRTLAALWNGFAMFLGEGRCFETQTDEGCDSNP